MIKMMKKINSTNVFTFFLVVGVTFAMDAVGQSKTIEWDKATTEMNKWKEGIITPAKIILYIAAFVALVKICIDIFVNKQKGFNNLGGWIVALIIFGISGLLLEMFNVMDTK